MVIHWYPMSDIHDDTQREVCTDYSLGKKDLCKSIYEGHNDKGKEYMSHRLHQYSSFHFSCICECKLHEEADVNTSRGS